MLNGKTGIVFGVANKRSIAWAIAQALAGTGMRLAFTYQSERLKKNVEELAANAADLDALSEFLTTEREGFRVAHDVSAYSLITLTRAAVSLMQQSGGGSVIAMTYYGAEKVVAGYNVMGVAKASLEASVRYLGPAASASTRSLPDR